MKMYISILIIFTSVSLSFNIASGDVSQEQKVSLVDYVVSWTKIVDDWKTPGRYAPVNLFDGKASTCFAVQNYNKKMVTDTIHLEVSFNKLIHIDEIRMINGFAKDQKSFYENTRVKKFVLNLSVSTGKDEDNKSLLEQEIYLKDIMEYQSIKLNKDCHVNTISIYASPNDGRYSGREPGEKQIYYPGSKYEDICLSELEFYYKGKKVNIVNSKTLKEDYIKRLQKDLVHAFSNRIYVWGDSSDAPEVKSYKDGTINYDSSMFGPGPKYPDRWKVENSKLYLNMGKWLLFEYMLSEKSIIIYDPEYEEGSGQEGWLHEWRFGRDFK